MKLQAKILEQFHILTYKRMETIHLSANGERGIFRRQTKSESKK
jgi:hypothetical protein